MTDQENLQRTQLIVGDIIDAIRGVLRKHEVTFDEYRAGFFHLIELAEAHEVPLLLDWIDGDRTNHMRDNLRLLCYNCYYQEVGNPLGGRMKNSY